MQDDIVYVRAFVRSNYLRRILDAPSASLESRVARELDISPSKLNTSTGTPHIRHCSVRCEARAEDEEPPGYPGELDLEKQV